MEPNVNEIDREKKKKCTCQRENFAFGTQRNLYSTDSCWGFALGVTQISAFLDTNMLVYPKRNCGVEGLSQRKDAK